MGAILHLTVNSNLVEVCCGTDLYAQLRGRMNEKVGIFCSSIVLQRQQTNAIGTWLDDTIVVNSTTDATRSAKNTLAENEGYGFRCARLCPEGAAQFATLRSTTVVHHQHTSLQYAKSTAQVIIVASNRVCALTFLDDAKWRIVAVVCRCDLSSQFAIGIREAKHIVGGTRVFHIALQRRALLGIQFTDAETRACSISLRAECCTLVQYHTVVLQATVHFAQVNVLRRESLAAMHQHHSIHSCRRSVFLERIDVYVTRITTPVVPLLIRVPQIATFTSRKEIQQPATADG